MEHDILIAGLSFLAGRISLKHLQTIYYASDLISKIYQGIKIVGRFGKWSIRKLVLLSSKIRTIHNHN